MATDECRSQWPEPYKTEGALTAMTDRADPYGRQWQAMFMGPGWAPTGVELRRYAVLAPDENLSEYPPTVRMDMTEWASSHADYGLDVDGQPLGGGG